MNKYLYTLNWFKLEVSDFIEKWQETFIVYIVNTDYGDPKTSEAHVQQSEQRVRAY